MMDETQDRNLALLAKGAGFGLIGKFAGRFLAIIGDILAARILGPSVFGLYAVGWTFFRLMEIIAPMGLDRGVLRFIPQYIQKGKEGYLKVIIVHSIGLSLLFGLILGFAVFFSAEWLSITVFEKPDIKFILQFFAVGFPLAALLPVIASITRATGNIKYAVLLQDVGQPLLALIVLGVLYIQGLRLSAILYSDIFSYAFVIIYGWFLVRKIYKNIFENKIPPEDTIITRQLIFYSIPVAFGGVFSALIYWVDRVFMGYFGSETEIGLYQTSSQLALLFAVVLSGISTILAPLFSDFYARKDNVELQKAYQIGNKWGIYLGIPFLVVLLLSPEKILSTLYGSDFSGGWQLLIILLIGQTINLATGASAPLMVMAGAQKIWFYLTFAGFLLDIFLILILAPTYGIAGIAAATSISVALLSMSTLAAVRWKMSLWPYDRRYLKGVLGTCVAIVVVWLIGLVNFSDVINLGLQLLGAIFAFGSALLLLGLDPEDLAFIQLLRARLNRLVVINSEN
jgi:O-antigen/teichoic acid export membrane protein